MRCWWISWENVGGRKKRITFKIQMLSDVNIPWFNMTHHDSTLDEFAMKCQAGLGNKKTHSVTEEHHLHCTHQSGQFDHGNWRHSGDDSGFVGGFKLRFRSLDVAYRWYTISRMSRWYSWVLMLHFLVQSPQSLKRQGHMLVRVYHATSWAVTQAACGTTIHDVLRMGECQRSGHMMLLALKSHGCYLQLVAGALGWLIGRDIGCQSGVEKDGDQFRWFP